MNRKPLSRPFLWRDYIERFNAAQLMDAQATAACDKDLNNTRNAAASSPGHVEMPQQWCLWLATLFDTYDEVAMRMLTAEQRTEQLRARQVLWSYCDALHDAVKTFDQHCEKAENSAVYGLTDLMSALFGNASQACDDLGESDAAEV